MIIVPPSPIFLNKGAVVFEPKETETIIHLLRKKRDQIKGSGVDRYGLLEVGELNQLIDGLCEYRGA